MPRITLTIDQLEAMQPCDMEARRALFGARKSLTVRQAIKADAAAYAADAARAAAYAAYAAYDEPRQARHLIQLFG